MRGVGKVAAGWLCGLALLGYMAGEEATRQQQTRTVPLSKVETQICDEQYAVQGAGYATEHVVNPGIYTLHCNSGQVYTVGNR